MLERKNFKEKGIKVVDWIDEYFASLPDLPVKSQVRPREIYNAIRPRIPEKGESIEQILQDTLQLIIPGITHWQHPNFHAYFPSNSSVESLLGEMVTSAIAAQCMIWDTSPAAAELEERMMEWLRDAMGLPKDWHGVIQDTASTATLVALICARERITDFKANDRGTPPNLRIYCSKQTHSSIEKGVAIAGIGRKNLIAIGDDKDLTLSAEKLKTQIDKDIESGLIPTCVIATIGTTGTVEVDDVNEIGKVCKQYNIWFHIDAAYAGTALLLPEYRWMNEGAENADSFVFNPHKWLFTNFDCTAYFVKDKTHLIRTFEILPEYLKTNHDRDVNDYRDWGIPLGRRFRALKLWFVLRSYGLAGIQDKLRLQIALNEYFSSAISKLEYVEIIKDPFLTFSCIRINPPGKDLNLDQLNEINEAVISKINQSGKAYLSHTKVNHQLVIRVLISQTYITQNDVDRLIDVIKNKSEEVLGL